MYVCLFAYYSVTGKAIVSKFSRCRRDGFTRKTFGRRSWVEARILVFFVFRGTGRCATAGRLGTAMGTKQAIGTHTGAGTQCADAIETGVGADGPARILHTGTGSGGLGRAKSGTGLSM